MEYIINNVRKGTKEHPEHERSTKMKMTKAQKIFQDTWTECRLHIKDWGMQYNPDGTAIGFNNMDTDEPMCTRTFNAIEKEIDKAERLTKVDYEIGIADDWTKLCEDSLKMVRSTLKNARELAQRY